MKPAPSTLERETTLPVLESIEFTIGDPRVLMEINAGQYSDIETAIIREYSTNAYDAHVMAGHADPIEITLPSVLDPFFEVRDHGVGMNREIFRQVYTQFGVSDKRDRNDANGQMGIGSKSGVAYATQFRVSSVRDGIKTEAKVRRGADWSISLDILTEDFTDEPNGTVIRIPIHNREEFCHKAMEFYKFWLPGRVVVNGKPSVHHVGQKIANNLYYSKDWYKSYVVMANVPYRIENPEALFRDSKLSSLHFVAYVDDIKMDDGAAPVQFTPSREDLKYTDRTKNTLRNVIKNFEADIIATAQAEVDAATTHAEAYTAWAKWKDTLSGRFFTDLTFRGDKFKSDFPVRGHRLTLNDRGYRNSNQAIRDYGVEACENTLFVEDFDITVSSSVKARVRAYVEQEYPDDGLSYAVFTKATSYDTVWVDWTKQKRVTWADLKAALPKTVSARSAVAGSGRLRGSWDYYTRGGGHYEETVPTDKTLLWISVADSKRTNETFILKALDSDAVVLVVPMNRLTKLRRENPQIQNFFSWARAQVITDGESLLSDDAKKVFSIDTSRHSWVNRLDTDRVDDADFKTIKSLLARRARLLKKYDHHRNLASYLHMGYNGFKDYEGQSDDGLLAKYPLLSSVSRFGAVHDDVYIYVNAKYAALTAESEKK